MAAPTMRSDFQPLCPDHQLPMLHCNLLLKWAVDRTTKPCYACATPGCTYHYDVIHGYFTASAGERIDRDMQYWQRCPNDGRAMYIATIEAPNSKRTWKCGQLGCAGTCVTEGSVKSRSAAST
jgi:hypothetical protein